ELLGQVLRLVVLHQRRRVGADRPGAHDDEVGGPGAALRRHPEEDRGRCSRGLRDADEPPLGHARPGEGLLVLGVLLFGLLCITFAISHVIPGDPARLAAGPDASEAMVQTLRAQYGLDRSLGTQFVVYTRGLLRGDFGLSLRSRNTVADDLARFFPNSFELVTLSLLLAVAVGVPLGMLSAVYRDTWIDHGSRVMSVS